MERISPRRSISRDDLAVFVAGPGLGEGVAVALPGGGWLLIDGCRTGGSVGEDLPLRTIWSTWQRDDADTVRWMLLTHPHSDHVLGFADVLDAVKPENIGMAGPPAPGRGLHAELSDWMTRQTPTEESLSRDQLLAAANAIRTWERRTGRRVTPIHDGVALMDGVAAVRALSPDPRFAESLAAQSWPAFRDQANLLSIVVEVVFGSTRLLLTGDLPHRVANGVHPQGWQRLAQAHPAACAPRGFKVPHHGSKDALHPALTAGPAARGMWVTPFSKNREPLPRWTAGEGLSRLLAVDSVKLTAPPRRPPAGNVRPGDEITRAQLGAWLTAAPVSGFLADAEDISLPTIPSALSPVWLSVFNDRGEIVREECGDSALRITSEATP